MPRKRKMPEAAEIAEPDRANVPKISEGIFYSFIIGMLIALISGAYYNSSPCMSECKGENIANGYPYPWFSYNTYGGWTTGSINWLAGILDIAFWMFIAFVVMLVLYAAIKEV